MDARVVILTGADSGIGLAILKNLLASGKYRIAALDLSDSNMSGLYSEYPGNLLISTCDVTDPEAVGESVEIAVSAWGGIDILVNNACLALFGYFEDKKTAEIRKEFEVNYFGAVNLINAVLPIMKAAGSGVIHNVSSGVGITGFPGISGYASTKGALEALTRTLAIELAPLGITVNLIHPPLTRTRSSSPLGIPPQFMETPERVGKLLAARVGSRKAVITADLKTSAGLWASRHFPGPMGRLLAGMTEKARKEGGSLE